MKYLDLYSMLESEPIVKEYFNKLPDDVQHHIYSRAHNVTSFVRLLDYAERLTRSDKKFRA